MRVSFLPVHACAARSALTWPSVLLLKPGRRAPSTGFLWLLPARPHSAEVSSEEAPGPESWPWFTGTRLGTSVGSTGVGVDGSAGLSTCAAVGAHSGWDWVRPGVRAARWQDVAP